MSKLDIEDLMEQFKKITDSDSKDDKKLEYTTDELKAMLDKEELDHDEASALLLHTIRHSSTSEAGLCAAYTFHNEDGNLACNGGVKGNAPLCALSALHILKSVLEKC